jgi:transcriptional regulatory protein LEU3
LLQSTKPSNDLQATFLYVAFAAAFLINVSTWSRQQVLIFTLFLSQLLRPKFIPLLDESQQKGIVASVRTLIQALGSKSVALDSRHTPALYSRFLSSQLARHSMFTECGADTNVLQTEDIIPQYRQERRQTPHLFAWPDTEIIQQHPVEHFSSSQPGVVLQQYGEANMDFSVQHFMDTVKTQDGISAKNFAGLRPDEIFADWESVHVNVVEKTSPDAAWSAIPTEADAWIRTLY